MYLVLGKYLSDDHDRAIRFEDQNRAIARGKELFGEGKTDASWCDKCICWHIRGKLGPNTPQRRISLT